MCVIVAVTDKRPSFSILDRCDIVNPHGIGIAWREGDVVKWKKNLSVFNLYKLSQELPTPYIIHFRWATVGGKDKDLIHPFVITENSEISEEGQGKRLLFHNGHYSDYDVLQDTFEIKLQGAISDSRVIASICSQFGYNVLKNLGRKGNRFAVLSSNDIKFFGKGWYKVDGIRYSNLNWLMNTSPSSVKKTYHYSTATVPAEISDNPRPEYKQIGFNPPVSIPVTHEPYKIPADIKDLKEMENWKPANRIHEIPESSPLNEQYCG